MASQTLTLTLRSDKAAVMDKFGHDMKQIISDLTVITTHMEQNKKQNKTLKTKKQKSTAQIKNKTNLRTSNVTLTCRQGQCWLE